MNNQLYHLRYPSIRSIIQYSSIEKRQNLVKWIPSLRKMNRKVPYCFDKVVLVLNDEDHDEFYDEDDDEYKNEIVFELDQLKWTILREDDGGKQLVTPNGTVLRTESFSEDVQALVRYYLFRENCTVKRMELQNIQCFPFSFSRIGSLEFLWTDEALRGTIGQSLTMFRDTSIGTMRLMVEMMDETSWKQEIENIRCEILHIVTEDATPDDLFDNLKFKKLRINEEFATVEKFIIMCEKLKNDQLEIGSYYDAWFRSDWNEFWNMLKEKLEVKTSTKLSKNIFTIPMANAGLEILVKRYRLGAYNMCRMEVVVKEDRTWQTIKSYPNDWFSQQSLHWRICFNNDIYNFLLVVLLSVSFIFYAFHSQNMLESKSRGLKMLVLMAQTSISIGTIMGLIHYFESDSFEIRRAGRVIRFILFLSAILFNLTIPFYLKEYSENDAGNVIEITLLDFSIEFNCYKFHITVTLS